MFLKTHSGTGNEHKHQQMQLEVPGQKNVSATCLLPREHWESCCTLQHCAKSRLLWLQGAWHTEPAHYTPSHIRVSRHTHVHVFSHTPWLKLLCGQVQEGTQRRAGTPLALAKHRGEETKAASAVDESGSRGRVQAAHTPSRLSDDPTTRRSHAACRGAGKRPLLAAPGCY